MYHYNAITASTHDVFFNIHPRAVNSGCLLLYFIFLNYEISFLLTTYQYEEVTKSKGLDMKIICIII